MLGEILYALLLILGVPLLLTLAVVWTRVFSDLLWLVPIRPWLIGGTVLAVMVILGIILRVALGLPPVGPLAFSIALVATPFASVPLSNFLAHSRRGEARKDIARRNYIFEAERFAQRLSYEAPRSDQEG